MRVTSKHLIQNYVKESIRVGRAEKAREAVERYSGVELPTLEEIREKHARGSLGDLNEVDHLLLRLEYEGRQADGLR